MIQKDIKIKGAEVLVLGITFKENCPDVRNTKAVDVISALEQYNIKVTIYDLVDFKPYSCFTSSSLAQGS